MAAAARVELRPVPEAARPALPAATFADAYAREDAPAAITAHAAAMAVLGGPPPALFAALMKLRHRIVQPLGLKTDELLSAAKVGAHSVARIGPFPVLQKSPTRVVLGLNDKHLDFRIVVLAEPLGAASRVTVSTLVLEHNALGRAYMAMVKPFHRWISRHVLARADFFKHSN
ncbi:DUF2867 domain-containing protein [Ottowia testudinis]|uniref:DUF2867 domain-containing protein n=1 Tax=Ottowia testudinis TaxID=2816950 RepID=A0A975H3K2_9BURK|nr:DUF2867 domain-containing protein [Ottowia testudinis]QTD45331.1 DUF2867 domain-containing protein [Ottowia testudinis]